MKRAHKCLVPFLRKLKNNAWLGHKKPRCLKIIYSTLQEFGVNCIHAASLKVQGYDILRKSDDFHNKETTLVITDGCC